MKLGSSTQSSQGDIRVECNNIRTYRGEVDTHLVAYKYTNAAGTVTEQTNILLPSLAAAPMGWNTETLTHSSLFPAQDGTLTGEFRGISTTLRTNEAMCVTLPADFDVSASSSAMVTLDAEVMYDSDDIDRLSYHMSSDHAHYLMARDGTRMARDGTRHLSLQSSAVALQSFTIQTVSITGCTLLRDAISLPITAAATRNVTTDAATGYTSTQTELCITVVGLMESELIARGMALYTLSCPHIVTSPYSHPARTDVTVYTRTEGHLVLDRTTSTTFPAIQPGTIGLTTRTASHDPGTAGRAGTLTVDLDSVANALDVGHTLTIELPVDWTVDACAAVITVVATSTSTPASCSATVSTTSSSALILTLDVPTAIPAASHLSIAYTSVTAPSYSSPALDINAYTTTWQGYTVDFTSSLHLAPVAPGVIGADAAAVLLSPFTASAVSSATLLLYPLPNGIPTGGYLTLALPASPRFPQLLDGAACSMTYFYPPDVLTTLPSGDIISGALVYDHGVAVTGSTLYTPASLTLKFTPNSQVPSDRIAHLRCSYLRNPASHQYAGVAFNVSSHTSAGTLIDTTDKMAIDSGYPASIHYTTQPADAALINAALPVAPVVGGTDYLGNAAQGGAYVSVSLLHNGNDPNALLSGNTTQLLSEAAARFPGLSVDTTGYGYQLQAFCYGTATVDSTPFSVWEGTDSSKFLWPVFPYLAVQNEPFTASAYVRLPNSTLVDTSASVDVTIRLYDAVTGADVSHLINGPRNATTVDGAFSLDDLVVTTPGTYYLTAFSSQGYFLPAATPRFRVVSSSSQRDEILFDEDELTVHASVSLTGLDGASDAEIAAVKAELEKQACAYVSVYYPGHCDRFVTTSIDGNSWEVDVLPHPTRGGRPNANELAELLRALIIDPSSIWQLADVSDHTVAVDITVDDAESEPWVTLGVVSGGLGVGVVSMAGALLRRSRAIA
jgi:hypothetical protein